MIVSWPDEWVRTRPICNWSSYIKITPVCHSHKSFARHKEREKSEVPCFELPDFFTRQVGKKQKGRLEQELSKNWSNFSGSELVIPRAPKILIIVKLVNQTGVREIWCSMEFRVDTAKHVEAEFGPYLKKKSGNRFCSVPKLNTPQQLADSQPFLYGR